MLDYLATALTKIYNVFVIVPRWLLVVLTGAIASTAINLLHSSKKSPDSGQSKTEVNVGVKAATSVPAATSPSTDEDNRTTSARKRGRNK